MGDRAPLRRDAQPFGETVEQRLFHLGHRGRGAVEKLGDGDDALRAAGLPALGQFGGGDVQKRRHLGAVHVVKRGALVEDRVAVEKAAGARDLAALDLDIVAGAVVRGDAEARQARRRRLADRLRDLAQRGKPQRVAVEHQFPAELALIQVKRAAAGHPPPDADSCGAAGVEVQFLTDRLMTANQNRGRKGQEPHRVGCGPGLVALDQRLIEGHLRAAGPGAGVDDAEGLHNASNSSPGV